MSTTSLPASIQNPDKIALWVTAVFALCACFHWDATMRKEDCVKEKVGKMGTLTALTAVLFVALVVYACVHVALYVSAWRAH